jgi:hypothetical protein
MDLAAIEEGREDQAFAVHVGSHQQHRAADRIQLDQVALMLQIAEQFVRRSAPSVLVEASAAVVAHIVGVHDAFPGREQPLDDVGRVLDHIDVEPEHPVLIV